MAIEHNISLYDSYGELTFHDIPTFSEGQLKKLFNEAEPVLRETLNSINEIKTTDYSNYKKEYAKQLKRDTLLKPRKKLHDIFKKYFQESEQSNLMITERIKNHSKVKLSDNIHETIRQVARLDECRNILRSKSIEEKKEIIQQGIERNDPTFLIACGDSPDSILPDKTLNEFQELWAFQVEPELKEHQFQIQQINKLVRRKAGELNATQLKMLMNESMEDPISKTEHFDTFQPVTEYEQINANSLIDRERERERADSLRSHHEEANQGINI